MKENLKNYKTKYNIFIESKTYLTCFHYILIQLIMIQLSHKNLNLNFTVDLRISLVFLRRGILNEP